MENERRFGKFALKKRNLVASVALSAALSAVPSNFNSEGHEDYKYTTLPKEIFSPVLIFDSKINDLQTDKSMPYSNSIIERPSSTPIIKSEKPLSKVERQVNHYKNESREILNMATNSGKFSKNQLKNWKIYGPIYVAAGEATKVDPINLWVTHEAESGASAVNSRAFNKDSYYIGGMQLSPLIFNAYKDKPLVKNLSKILKKEFKVRHKGDIENIIIASLYIGANENTIRNSKVKSEQKGFIRFVGSRSAGISRYKESKRRKEILSMQERKEVG